MIDAGTLGVFIPIIAVGGWIIPVTVKSITKSQERRLAMRLQAQQGTNDETARQIAALRAEVAALRDTSTQFDMSLENAVHRLEGRVDRMETKAAVQTSSTPEQQQTFSR